MQSLPEIYEWTGPTGVAFRDVRAASGAYYHDTTPPRVVELLERYQRSGQRVRLFYGDQNTGKSWHEEYDVIGRIGRSLGPHKIPLLIRSARSTGGGAILTDCIVAIAVAPGVFDYRHPSLDLGTWTVGPAVSEGYVSAAYCDGELHAQFRKSDDQARRYIAFMKGERFAK